MIKWYKKQGVTIRAAVIGGMFAILAAFITVAVDIMNPAPTVIIQIPPTQVDTETTLTSIPYATSIVSTPIIVQPPYRGDIDICQDLVVIPFLKRISLVFLTASKDSVVRITYYDEYNIAHSLENGIAYGNFDLSVDYGYVRDGANERYIINNPYPGTWIIESNYCGGLDPYYEPIIAFGGDHLDFESATRTQINSYYIKYFAIVNDEYKLRPPENPDFAFQVVTKIVRPDKTITSYEMEWVKSDESFVSKDAIDFSQPGEYKVDVIIYLPNCNFFNVSRIGEIPAVCKGLQEYHRYSESFSIP